MLKKHDHQQGFTLLELLIVVSIMAIIAGMGLMSHKGTQDYSKDQAVRVEMKQLQQAIIRYFRDQNSIKDWDEGLLQTSPADIGFLIFAPTFDPSDLDSDGDTEENEWDPDYRTGWRGPYIKPGEFTTPYVSISDSSDTGLEFNGNGSPDGGTVVVVHAKPDPYSHISIANVAEVGQEQEEDYFSWRKESGDLSELNPEIPRLGRPYLFFDLDTYSSTESKARIVSMGQDGEYEFPLDCDPDETSPSSENYCWCDLDQSDENHARFCTREDVCESLGDDLVLCL